MYESHIAGDYLIDARFCDLCGRGIPRELYGKNNMWGNVGSFHFDLCPDCKRDLEMLVNAMRYNNGMMTLNYKVIKDTKNLLTWLKLGMSWDSTDLLDISEARKRKMKKRLLSRRPRRFPRKPWREEFEEELKREQIYRSRTVFDTDSDAGPVAN